MHRTQVGVILKRKWLNFQLLLTISSLSILVYGIKKTTDIVNVLFPDEIATSSEYIDKSHNLTIFYDPPYNASCPTVLGLFVRAYLNGEEAVNARIYYVTDEQRDLQVSQEYIVTENSLFATYNSPYIQLTTPFKASRIRVLAIIAVLEMEDDNGDEVKIRSDLVHLRYYVEGQNRPDSYGGSPHYDQ
jgi:hypothetical protein